MAEKEIIDKFLEQLEILGIEINTKLNNVNKEKEKRQLEEQLDRIISIGTAFEDENHLTMIDIDTLEEILRTVSLTDKEKEEILFHTINQNNKVYEKNIKNKKEGKITEIESQEEIEINIDRKKLNKLNELLKDNSTKERITLIVNKNIKSLSITNEMIEKSVDEVRKIIIRKIKYNPKLTPEEALEEYFRLNELSSNNKRETLREILKDSEKSDLNKEKQQKQILKALVYYEENKELLKQLTNEKKKTINKYIQSIFKDIKNRVTVYKNELIISKNEVIKIAVYEIEILKDLMNSVNEKEKDYELLISKLSKRYEDILRCVEECQNNVEDK